ncbi:TPA: RsmD family RNA methyltransferase, partial [Pseudomonas aeruginosa]|nr:RsmD family RNA methyltransferase [Pseudomonas aeruginosa]
MSKPTAKAPGRHGGQGQLRIIGGEWRSRRLVFPDGPGLRPTPDRVRETLFNWL